MQRNRHTKEFENQALLKVRERGDKSVRVVAQELNMSEGTLRKWITKSNQNRCRWGGCAYFSPQQLRPTRWFLRPPCRTPSSEGAPNRADGWAR